MLIYILHQNCYYTFDLSTKTDGNYIISDYDLNYNERSLVNVQVTNGKAYISDNNNVKIFFNDQSYQNAELVIGNFYTLNLISDEKVLLYVSPLRDDTFIQKVVADNCSIKIGSDNKNDIIYYGVTGQVELKYDGNFHIKTMNGNTPIYVNRNLKNDIDLDNFDCIFINGLKIIVCKNTLFINNVCNRVFINSKNLLALENENLAIKDIPNTFNNFKDFYDEGDYFFKSPVFQHKSDELKINISEPPAKEEKDDESVFMTAVPTFIMSLASVVTTISSVRQYRSGETDSEQLLTELLMAASILIGGIAWPFIEKWVRNIKIVHRNHKRKKRYLKYLNEKEEIFKKALNEQKVSLAMNNPTILECKGIIEGRKAELFNRNIENANFLNLRLGTGKSKLNCNLDYQKQEYIWGKDPLVKNLEELVDKYKYIDESPYILSLKKAKACAFIVDNNVISDYMNNILLQILTYHSYLDLKIVVFTSKSSDISYLKNTNHCWDDERSMRYYATTVSDAQNISSVLERELNQRKLKNSDENAPYYLVVSDCIDLYRNLNIIDDILTSDPKYNFGLLMFDNKTSDIPNKCMNFVNISKKEGAFFQTDMSSGSIEQFKPEFVSDYGINVPHLARIISDIPLKNNSNASMALPDNYDFLEMYNVGNIEQLNVGLRWDNSNLYNSLATPLGIDVNGNIVNLDLHEKNHGPHGLIAGMTGSGKSELIITYILSLAINYRPNEVQFVLIDYKGGGLASAFENRKTGLKLPHLVGTITNLDQAEMKRTLVSIKSELQRRQKLFNEAKENLDSGNIDIYKYQRLYREGKLNQPLSHLFIICDEFAELKAQQPDFMDELVSAARIGRSLGVHLILATQKPSGIVDEQIWSNSKFKISCKVQTTEDSNEVIRKPDAAFLKESGRFYLQVGYDEYFIEGQSAYTGNNYVPTDTYNAKLDNSISFINDSGEVVKSASKKEEQKSVQKNIGDELTNILKYIIKVADEKGFEKQQLWLDNIPPVIYQNRLVLKYNVMPNLYIINPVIGEFDDPKNQRQGPVYLDITNGGNTFIAGSSGSGKTTLLSTFIYANIINHNCDELNIYAVDCGTEKLKIFQNAPQVGEVLTVSDSEKIKNLFFMVNNEIVKRQKYYAKMGTDFISETKNGKASFNNLIIIINDMDVFKEAYEDLFDDQFVPMSRNCSKYGIYFVVTGTSTNALGFLAENNFPQKVMLNMVDSSDYMVFFNNPPIPNKNPGRGIVEVGEAYEFQTALVFREEDYAKNITYVFEQLNKFLKNPAKPIPIVPKSVSFDMIDSYITSLDNIPLGVDEQTAQIGYVNFNNLVNVMSAYDNKILRRFIPNLVKIIARVPNTKVIVINALTKDKFSELENVKEYNSGFKKVISVLKQNAENSDSSNDIMVLIIGYSKLQDHLKEAKESDSEVVTLDELVEASAGKNFRYLIYEKEDSFDDFRQTKAYSLSVEDKGLWLGGDFDSQDVFEQEDSLSDEYRPNNNDITIVDDSKNAFIKFVK